MANENFFEGDFHSDTKKLEPKYRIAYSHEISDIEENCAEIEYSRRLLRDEFIPRIPIFTDLSKFQEYILNNFEVIDGEVQLIPALIAAKLKGLEALEKVVAYLLGKSDIILLEPTSLKKRIITEILLYAKAN